MTPSDTRNTAAPVASPFLINADMEISRLTVYAGLRWADRRDAPLQTHRSCGKRRLHECKHLGTSRSRGPAADPGAVPGKDAGRRRGRTRCRPVDRVPPAQCPGEAAARAPVRSFGARLP